MIRPKSLGYGGGIISEPPSSNLWVGNLPADVTESDLVELFGKHGLLGGLACYASRSYAFVYYKRAEDAISAKNALQGFLMKGTPIKIEFAKPAKASKHVWVGGFGSSITKEKLEEELSKFGKIEEFKFFRDRNTALVDFTKVEDASAVVKNLNGLQIGHDRIRVDFLRSHPARREQSDLHDMGGAQFKRMGGIDPSWTGLNIMRNYLEPNYSVHKTFQSFGGHIASQPSKVLWVGYPPSVVIDKEMLHNAMILYGEIERILCFPARHHFFVEFRSAEEARRAKEALQGRLFNDPRITIVFSNNDLAPGNNFGTSYPGYRGDGPGMIETEGPFRPPLMDVFPSNRGVAQKIFTGLLTPNGLLGPGIPRPFAPRGSLDPLRPSPELNNQMSDLITHAPSSLNQSKPSPPAPGLPPAPSGLGRTSHKRTEWDVLDPSQRSKESKRSRMDGTVFLSDHHLIAGKGDEHTASLEQSNGAIPAFVGGSLPRVHPGGGLNVEDMGVAKVLPHADGDYIWRGVIAKGGTSVCRARCIPIGNGLERALPEVVNCSARTGLDMLKKHYTGSIGFDIVFFLPDREEDFANYTEFLRYLGSKNRAGVAKLDDGTTLFLVPPSEFLAGVLKVTGQERLYGVVLKYPQQLSGGASTPQQVHQLLPPVQHMESQLVPPKHEYVDPVFKKEIGIKMDHGSVSHAERNLPSKAPFPPGFVPKDQFNNNSPSTSRPGAVLTPELIATLATLLPENAQAPVGLSSQSQLRSSTTVPSVTVSTNENEILSQGWNQQPQVFNQTGQASQQFSSQLYSSAQLSNTFLPFPVNLNSGTHPVQILPDGMPIQNPAYTRQEQGSVSPGARIIHPVAPQNQQILPSTWGMQSYHFDSPNNTHKGFDAVYGTHAGTYSMADTQQPKHLTSYTNPFDGVNLSHPENVLPNSTGSISVESLNQTEKLQQMPPAVGLGAAEVEADKNQRYQSTLQFAASLLFQIQQQQQQKASSNMGN